MNVQFKQMLRSTRLYLLHVLYFGRLPLWGRGGKVSATGFKFREGPFMRPALFAFAICAFLSGCATFPEVDAAQTQFAAGGPAPQLVPIDGLIAQAGPGRASEAASNALAARAANLRARSRAMRGPVHSATTRARLAAAVAAYPSKFD